MNGLNELAMLGNLLWFLMAAGLLFMLMAPFLIWKNTAETTRLMRFLVEEQERTNDLLEAILEQQKSSTLTDDPKNAAIPENNAFTLEEK